MKKPDKLFKFITDSKLPPDYDALEAELDHNFGETCATLVLDSSGFTRTTKLLGPAFFLSLIARMRETCFATVKRHNAISARAWADNVYAEFPTADDAVAAALAIHRHFDENPVPLLNPGDWFGLSAGIGYGRVLRSEHEGVYGDEMNSASKLGEDIAERGETLLTEAAYQALSRPRDFQVKKSVTTISGVQMKIYSLLPKPEKPGRGKPS